MEKKEELMIAEYNLQQAYLMSLVERDYLYLYIRKKNNNNNKREIRRPVWFTRILKGTFVEDISDDKLYQ